MNARTLLATCWLTVSGSLLACSSDSTEEPSVVQTVELTRKVNDAVYEKATFKRLELEEPAHVAANPGARAALFVRDKTERSDGKPVAATALTAVQLDAFVRDQWDAAVGTKEDPGRDALAFMNLLKELHVSPGRFIRAHRASGATVAEFTAFTRSLVPLNAVHGTMGVHLFLDLLEEGGVKLADLQAALATRGVPHTTLIAELAAHPSGVHQLRLGWKRSGKTLVEVLKAAPPLSPKALPQTDPNSVIGVSNASWDMIRDHTHVPRDLAEGTRSGALNVQDLTRTNYTGGTTFVGARFDDSLIYYGGSDILGSTTHYRGKGNIDGTYGATHAGYGGTYLSDAYVSWAELDGGDDLTSAVASMDDLFNMGSVDAPNPNVTFTMTFKYEDDDMGHAAPLILSWQTGQILAGSGPQDAFGGEQYDD